MKWLLLVLLVIVVAVVISAYRLRETRRQRVQEDLATARRAVDEDVTVLGEELQRLDADLPDRALDPGTGADYQRALDSYEAAKESAAAMQRAEDAQHVVEILDDGRYAIACVRASVAGEPLPARRPACFFDPRHGPSVTDVSWAPPGGAVRDVPACAQDAERVDSGAEPHTRQVMVGSRRVPYWQAGGALSPMAAGYFGSFGLMNALFLGTTMGMAMGYGGGWGDEGSDSGSDSGSDGGSDGGSDTSAGGDWGGGDWGGGGDFGGDFGGGF